MLSSTLLFFSFSASEIMFILFVALILFGGDKFPEIARGLGKGLREFKDMSDGVKREIHSQINNYDVNNNSETETRTEIATSSVTETPPPVVEDHQSYNQLAEHHPAEVKHDDHQVTSNPQPADEQPAAPKFTPPANTISRESY